MKVFILASLFFSQSIYAQTLDMKGLKNLFIQKKTNLERVNVGMSKKVITNAIDETDLGNCAYTRTSIQTVLKIEGPQMIVHAKESFTPAQSEGCVAAGYEAFEESMLFYEEVPNLENDLKDLDEATGVRSISRSGDIVTLVLSEDDVTFTYKYDFTKSSFKNLISTVSTGFSVVTQDMADIDVTSINLKEILFCENNDNEISNCVDGDFSDIFF